MPEAAGVWELVAARALPGGVLGIVLAALLWLAGLVGFRGAAAAAAALVVSFLAGSWPVALLFAGTLALLGLASRATSVLAAEGAVSDRLGASSVVGITSVALLLIASPLAGTPVGYAQAAAIGALLAAGGTWLAAQVGAALPGPVYRLLGPAGPPGSGKGITAPGLGAGLGVATIMAWAAMGLHLLGVGDPGLVLLGVGAGMAVTGASSAAARGTLQGLLLASGVAALASLALVALLP